MEHQSMDISVPHHDVADSSMDGTNNAPMESKNPSESLPPSIGPVAKDSNEPTISSSSTQEVGTSAAPLLHEHHRQSSNSNGSAPGENSQNENSKQAKDIQAAQISEQALSPSDLVQKEQHENDHDLYRTPCHSIEEASVDTTIQSVTMEDTEKAGAAGTTGNTGSAVGNCVKEDALVITQTISESDVAMDGENVDNAKTQNFPSNDQHEQPCNETAPTSPKEPISPISPNTNERQRLLNSHRSKSVGGDGNLVGILQGAGSCRHFSTSVQPTTMDVTAAPNAIPPSESETRPTSPKSSQYPPTHRKVLLRLTPEEEKLFQLLVHAAEAYERGDLVLDPNPTQQSVSARGGFTKEAKANEEEGSWMALPPPVKHIEIRIAGGWVRDKLLNQHSSDVDVALDCMMGVQFARIVQSFMAREIEKEEKEKREQEERKEREEKDAMEKEEVQDAEMKDVSAETKNETINHDNTKKKQHPKQTNQNQPKKKGTKSKHPKIAVIGANPSQSKHLETATMTIHGIDIDFVNLRAEEVYEENSRIPTTQTRNFGTPLEDALRRDFTINSLFYNIRTHKIEDWTGRGLDDLMQHRRIVTPVDPHETFHDDPLRVLRAIRFCVRLDFTLDSQIVSAAMSHRIHHSLHVKVSRERVGKELEGMMTGKGARPGVALDLIAELHLSGSVFCFPGSFPGENEHACGPVQGSILGVEYHGCLGRYGRDGKLRRSVANGESGSESEEREVEESVALAARQRARGWEESSRLLKFLPGVLEGHMEERERVVRELVEKDGLDEADHSTLFSKVDTRLLHLCIFILPFHNLTFPDSKGRQVSVTSHMIKEALKFPTRDIMAVGTILKHVDDMTVILREIRKQLAENHRREESKVGGEGEDGSAEAHCEGAVGGEADTVAMNTVMGQLSPPCRLRTGLLLRSLKEHWVTCLLTAAVWEIRSLQRQETTDSEGSEDATSQSTSVTDGNTREVKDNEENPDNLQEMEVTSELPAASSEQATASEQITPLKPFSPEIPKEQLEEPSRQFYRAILTQLNLDQCWRIRPLLDGKSLISELGLPKGPLVGEYLQDQVEWMLLNPKGTREECVDHLRERKREREQGISNQSGESGVCLGKGSGQDGKDGKMEVVDEQNEITMGVANGEGHSSPIGSGVGNGTKHFSKKIRAENLHS